MLEENARVPVGILCVVTAANHQVLLLGNQHIEKAEEHAKHIEHDRSMDPKELSMHAHGMDCA